MLGVHKYREELNLHLIQMCPFHVDQVDVPPMLSPSAYRLDYAYARTPRGAEIGITEYTPKYVLALNLYIIGHEYRRRVRYNGPNMESTCRGVIA